jgi:flagellar biosynthesis/type III secretory pathway protein FliH
VSDLDTNKINPFNRTDGVVFKGITVGSQAEQLVKVRREITETQELTRIEQLENEARLKIESTVERARIEADEILGNARREAVQIKVKARTEGDLEAKRDALEKLEGLITGLENEIQILKETRMAFLDLNLSGIIDFSCNLAKKILVCEMQTRPKVIAERAKLLLERMPSGVDVTLAASPSDIEIIRAYFKETSGISGHVLAHLRADSNLQPGSIILESDNGRINARFLEALEELGSLLKDQSENPEIQSCNPAEDRNDG